MKLPVDKLKPGMQISENVYKSETDKLPFIPAEVILTESIINRLKIAEIKAVSINFKGKSTGLIDDSLEVKIVDTLKNKDEKIEETLEYARVITSSIVQAKKYSFNLLKYAMELESEDERTLNIASMAVGLAKEFNKIVPEDLSIDLNNLAATVLLAKIGKVGEKIDKFEKIPKIKLPERLFPDFKMDVYRSYDPKFVPVYSYAMLNGNTIVPSIVKASVLYMEENGKGTGPLRVKLDGLKNSIKNSVKIVLLVLWNDEHIKMLENYPDKFDIKHYVSIAWLKKK